MIHAVEHMGEDILHRCKSAVRNNAFHLWRQIKPAHHADRRSAHGIAVKDDLHIFTGSLYHPVYPAFSVQPVHIAEADVFAFASAMGSLIDQEHPESVFQIIMGKAAVIIKPFACISVETDHRFISFSAFEICTVEFRPSWDVIHTSS